MSRFPSWKLFFVSIIVSLGGSFHFGYQLVITNPSQNAFISFLNESYWKHYGSWLSEAHSEAIWSVIVAILFAGAIIGSFSLGYVAEKIGRKRGLYLSFTLSIISVSLSIASFFGCSFELYAASRVLFGYSLGLSLGLSALFLNECSPKECRGFVSMMTGTAVQFGTVTGSILAIPSLLGSSSNWWYIYLIELIILIIVFLMLPMLPESPGYLTLCGNDEAARHAILFFHGCKIGAVDGKIFEIKENLKENSKAVSVFGVWKDKHIRKGTIVGMTISFAMGFSGIAVINAYAVEILKGSGLSLTSASIGNIALSVVSLIAILFSSFVVDRFGRRPLILIANSAIILLNFIIFALMFCFQKFQYSWIGFCLIAIISVFIVFFAIGPGPLCYFVTSEIVGQPSRASSQSWASLMQMFCRTLLLATYLPISNQIGQPFTYLILFVLPVIASTVFLYFNMPETKNKNYNEVVEAIANLPSFSQFLARKKIAKKIQIPIKGDDFSVTEGNVAKC